MLKMVTYYSKGILFVVCIFAIANCGAGDGKKKERRIVIGQPDEGSGDEEFNLIANVVEENCNTCHNGQGLRKFDASNFKDSAAAARIRNSANPMPPRPQTLSKDAKDALLGYLDG